MERVIANEILELDNRVWKALSGSGYEFGDERFVVLSAESSLRQSQIKRVAAQSGVVRTHIESNRQTLEGRNATARAVQDQLAYRDTHSVGAEIAQTQNSLAICHDNHPDIALGPLEQHLRNAPAIIRRNKNAARPAEDGAVLLTRLAYCRRIDQRQHLFHVVDDRAIKQRFVTIQQGDEKNVALKSG